MRGCGEVATGSKSLFSTLGLKNSHALLTRVAQLAMEEGRDFKERKVFTGWQLL